MKFSIKIIIIASIILIMVVGYLLFYKYVNTRRQWAVPGPMVVTEFDPNSFPYQLQKKIEVGVNKIITEEVNKALKQKSKTGVSVDYSKFRPKERLWITLYYVGDISESKENLFVNALNDIQKLNFVKPVKISDHFEFFGNIKELVVKIDDEAQGLTNLRANIKDALISLNGDYKKTNGKDLYDPSFSEKYPYQPHITFGRISSQVESLFKKHGISPDEILERIRNRIKNELPSLLKLTDKERTLSIDSFQLNSSDRKILKKFTLSQYKFYNS